MHRSLRIADPIDRIRETDPRTTSLKKTGVMEKPRSAIEMVTSHRQIALHYLTGWFLIDLVSILTCLIDIIPVVQNMRVTSSDEGASATVDAGQLEQLRILRVLRVLRLIKLVRLIKSSRILKRWQTSIALDFSTQTVISCLASYLFAGHWFASILVLTTTFAPSPVLTWLGDKGFCRRSDDPSSLPWGKTWRLMPTPFEAEFAHLDNVYCVSSFELWMATYYWMIQLISGAAGGDTYCEAMNAGEQAVFTVLVVLSCLLMSQVIAAFCDVLSNLQPENVQFRNQMDQLNRYCRTNSLAPAVRRQLRDYLYRTKHVQINNSQRDLMMLMSPKLQGELSLQINGPWLTHVPFLKSIETRCLVRIALALEPLVFVPTEILPTDNLYHLARGTVVHNGMVLLGGSVWGTDCYLSRIDLRTRPARALTHAEVSRIARDPLVEIIHSHVVRLDGKNNEVKVFEYPTAVKRLRWEAVKTGMIREMYRRAAEDEEKKGGKKKFDWTKAFSAMEREAADRADNMASHENAAPGTSADSKDEKRPRLNRGFTTKFLSIPSPPNRKDKA